jgi:lipid A ethanolaminephosphotransferase
MKTALQVSRLKGLQLMLSSGQFRLLLCAVLALFYNGPLWQLISAQPASSEIAAWLFMAAFFSFMVAVLQFFLTLVGFRQVLKPLAIFILLSASAVSYFMHSYGILVDRSMVQNLFETDTAEAGELLNAGLMLHLLLSGVLPALLVMSIRIRYRPVFAELRGRVAVLFLCLMVVGANGVLFYKDYSSLFRNNRQIRNLAVPSSYLYYGTRYLLGAYDPVRVPLQRLGEDAHQVADPIEDGKRKLLVLVVGETARAMNFGLNGYVRDTNPQLNALPVLSFGEIASCGTSTAESLPCMFSLNGRDGYDKVAESHRENLLDVLQHAGVTVLWRDNNSGCKGVCDRVDSQETAVFELPEFCGAQECYDEGMLSALDAYLQSTTGDAVIVLHQKGSHGPAYYLRYPQQFEKFTPVCRSTQLQSCSQSEILNAYDNSILYTDYFLSRVIGFLKSEQQGYDTAMLYMSDHGESLGEGNIYLHGMPYMFAPKEQTHVPFMAWLSDGMQLRTGLDSSCLGAKREQALSHDNLAHSVLGLMGVTTSVYQPGLDIFDDCRQPLPTGSVQQTQPANIQFENSRQGQGPA